MVRRLLFYFIQFNLFPYYSSDGRGSEHTVDGQSFSGELHIVHWNSSKYQSFQEAAGHPDGLAVLGVFLKVGKEHEELDQIARLMPFITHKGDRVSFKMLEGIISF